MPANCIALRTASVVDLPALQLLVERAIAELLAPFLSSAQLQASLEIMGLDTQLIADDTYFIAEMDGALAGCGGWSRRATHFGGDHSPDRNARTLNSAEEPARIRAMYTHPAFVRRGIGRAVLKHCEGEARAAGFRSVELVATLAGVPLYATCGYRTLNRFNKITPGGIPVPLVEMQKQL